MTPPSADPFDLVHTARGIPSDELLVPYPSFRSLLESQARWRGNAIFWSGHSTDGERSDVSFSELYRLACQGANLLKKMDIVFGDRVSVSVGGDIPSFVALCSLWTVGATAVIVHPELDTKSRARFLAAAQCRSPELIRAAFAPEALAPVPHEFQIGKKSKLSDDLTILQSARGGGIVLSHYNVLVSAMAVAQRLRLTKDSVITSALFQSSGDGLFGATCTALYAGCRFILEEEFASTPRSDIPEAHYLFGRHPSEATSRRMIVPHDAVPADAASPSLLPALFIPEATSFVAIRNPVASAEPRILLSPHGLDVGPPLHATEVSILDDAGRVLAQGEVGEVAVRGHAVMMRYLDGGETEQAFKGGWLRTGVRGKMEARAE